MFEVPVTLAARRYPVYIGNNLLGCAAERLEDVFGHARCAIVTDSNVAGFYAADLPISGAPLIALPPGETAKNLSQVEAICNRLLDEGLDRNAFLIALGGGVIGDLVGFVAAIFMRGIPYVQIPTTLVAQVDSSVGGKTGVNARAGKNLIGAFHQPRLVIADVDTLRTLPDREFNAGMAEVIKHGIIRDRAMLESLENLDRENLAPLIARNVEIKAEIVSSDERETCGERALLNFGHTIGHAIENAAGYGRFLHGEAISLGIIAACRLSMRKAGFPHKDCETVLQHLNRFDLPTILPSEIQTMKIMTALQTDKKFARGEVRFVLSPQIGEAFVSADVSFAEIETAIEELRNPAEI
jgi:3-dehydroquinate synthase